MPPHNPQNKTPNSQSNDSSGKEPIIIDDDNILNRKQPTNTTINQSNGTYNDKKPIENTNSSENQQKDYAAILEAVQQSLIYIIKHPYRAYCFNILRNIVPSCCFPKRPIMEAIAEQLSLMGLNEEVFKLQELLKAANYNSEIKDKEKPLKDSLTTLYAQFQYISSLKKYDDHASLKKLKKLIHQFADEIDAPKRLYNLNKLAKKIAEPDYHPYYEDFNAILTAENAIREKRQYAYICSDIVESIGSVTSLEEKLKRRKIKKILKWVSFFVAVIVGLGESLVAAVFAAYSWPLLVAVLVVGIPAFLVNYFLFRQDCYDVLKQIFISGLYKDKNDNDISLTKKRLIRFTLFSCGSAAIALGFLSYGAAYVAIGALIACPPVAMVAAVIIALVTTIALATIFYSSMAGFIKNDKHQDVISYFKKNYYDIWKYNHNGKKSWSTITKCEKLAHIIKQVPRILFNLFFLVLALAPSIIIIVASMGLLHAQAIKIMTLTMHLPAHLSSIFAYILIEGLATFANGFFYAKGIIELVNGIKKYTCMLFSAIKDPQKAYDDITSYFSSLNKNKTLLIDTIVNSFTRVFLSACVTMNSEGQAMGVLNSSTATRYTCSIFPGVPKNIVKYAGAVSMGMGSGGPNLFACNDATHSPDVISSPVNQTASPTEHKTPERFDQNSTLQRA